MYYEHFGLSKPPFKITPDTSMFFSGGDRGSVLEALSYAVLSGEGITKVIGEVGTGKTMLCRMLEVKLSNNVEIIYIANPSISPENILNVIAFELDLIKKPSSKLEVMQLIQAWLLKKHAENCHVVVFIEEAQGMPLETLEEIRLLSNLETEHNKLMQIVLFGQPELDDNLKKPSIRQLKERIAHSFHLKPLDQNQIKEYLNFRIRTSGYRGPDIFDDKVVKVIARYSKGLIRRANIIADKTLLSAYAESTGTLKPHHAKQAAMDSDFYHKKDFKLSDWKMAFAGMAVGFLIAIPLWYGISVSDEPDVKHVQVNKSVPDEQLVENITIENQLDISEEIESSIEDIEEDSLQSVLIDEELEPIKSERTLLGDRLDATHNWLAAADESSYSIQIMTLRQSSEGNLASFLSELPESINLDEIYIYESEIKGRAMYGVLYKVFEDKLSAKTTVNNISSVFQNKGPFLLRTVRGLKREIARSRS